jgi:hypothetical protein
LTDSYALCVRSAVCIRAACVRVLCSSVDNFEGNLRFKVFDHDKVGKNDFAGYVSIPLAKLKAEVAVSGWFPLKDRAKPKASMGSLHVSAVVDVVDRAAAWTKPNKPSDAERAALESVRRSLFAQLELRERKAHFETTQFKDLTICCATWNVGTTRLCAPDLSTMPSPNAAAEPDDLLLARSLQATRPLPLI